MKEILKTLVEIPSITGNYKANNEAIEYIDRSLSERGMHVKRLEFNNFESLVATTRKTKKPKLLLAAHVDVVSAPRTQFNFQEKGGRYYGRGVFDMKFAIAAYLQLIDDLNGSLGDYDFGLMITSDEESGGFNGVKRLIEEGFAADVVILPDAGDTPQSWKLERSAKGRLSLKIQATGKSAHGSRPWKGENAIDTLIAALDDIRALTNDQGPHTDTIAVCTIQGGEAFNQIPASASADLDIRTLSNKSHNALRVKINRICERHKVEMTEDTVASYSAYKLDKSNSYVTQFISCVEQIIPKDMLVEADSTGGSDARFFAAAGVPCIVASPPGDGYHAAAECVSVEGLEQLRQALHLYVDAVAKLPVRQPVDAEALTV